MKENKYDNEQFFEKYSEMERSKKGLDGAGEWSELKKILPIFKEKKVLDLGCGYGWHCKYAVEHGADFVLGTDISSKMLEVAIQKNNDARIKYQCVAMEDLDFQTGTFDISLWLKKGGEFVFSVEHPVFTSHGTQDWYYDKDGNILHFPVDNYYYEGKREAVFLGEKVIKYHRTLTTYLNTLLQNGFMFQHIIEPQPPENMMNIPGMQNEMRRPMMLLISAKKL